MPRCRGIKPKFFTDESIAVLKCETRLCFIGLWTLADRDGRLEDKPLEIKSLLFPSDLSEINKKINIFALLEELTLKPFIVRYEVKNHKYIQLLNFHKHQHPHHTEVESIIPEHNGVITVIPPLSNGYTSPTHEMNTNSKQRTVKPMGTEPPIIKAINHTSYNVQFENLWKMYPSKGRLKKKKAYKMYQSTIKTEKDQKNIGVAINNYIYSKRVRDGYVQNADRWFSEWQDWVEYKETAVTTGRYIPPAG